MTGSPAASPQGASAEGRPKVTPEIAAEAAVWLARLHGPSRTKEMEQAFLAWQASSAAHREAVERSTDVWQDMAHLGAAAAHDAEAPRRESRPFPRHPWRDAARRWATTSLVAIAVAACAVFVAHWRGENVYGTKVGEQRLVVLEDGSRVLMNTDTRMRVDLAARQRTVDVSHGEAFFEVAKDASRPFVVRIAGSEVVAVGTAFSVRYAPGARAGDALTVTLVEGRVDVRPAQRHRDDALAPRVPVVMNAGERLLLERTARNGGAPVAAKVDRPDVEHVLAWKRSEADFDNTALADAVAEMNRYNRTPIVLLDDLGTSGLHVSGVYRTSDGAGFAHAVAALHGLTLRDEAGRLELAKPH